MHPASFHAFGPVCPLPQVDNRFWERASSPAVYEETVSSWMGVPSSASHRSKRPSLLLMWWQQYPADLLDMSAR